MALDNEGERIMKLIIDWKSFKQKGLKKEKNPFPIGTRAYQGFQGRGKSYSIIHDALEIRKKYPDCVIFSNIKIDGVKNCYYCRNDNDIYYGLNFDNGAKGVINIIDEAHLFFNKKTGISIDVLTQISQQRKQRRKIFISSQIWEDLDISLRKQVPEIVKCWNIGNIQINRISNGETLRYDKTKSAYVADLIGFSIHKRNKSIADKYDTYQKIETNKTYNRVILTPSFTPPPSLLKSSI